MSVEHLGCLWCLSRKRALKLEKTTRVCMKFLQFFLIDICVCVCLYIYSVKYSRNAQPASENSSV